LKIAKTNGPVKVLDKKAIYTWEQAIPNTIMMEFPYRENTYAFENNYFVFGDLVLIDGEVYIVMSEEAEAWGPDGSSEVFFLYTLNGEVPRPMGAQGFKVPL
jgi:hypothetical protein